MQIRANIDDKIMKELMKSIKENTGVAVTKQAISVFKWAVDESKKGRKILSTNKSGGEVERLVIPGVIE